MVFTTAYDAYAIEAFKYLSVDYLLKPVKESALEKALVKYHDNFRQEKNLASYFSQLQALLQSGKYKNTFICKRGKNRYPVKTDDIACFFAEDRETWVLTLENKEFLVAQSLEQLEASLNPEHFFRANRKVICARDAVEKFEILAKSKIKLTLSPTPSFDITISSEKSAAFKEWLERE